MEKLLLALANKYLLDKFEEIQEIEEGRFMIEGDTPEYKYLRFEGKIDLGDLPEDEKTEEVEEAVDRWLETEDKLGNKAREIEEGLEGDVMIYTYLDRK